MIHLSAIDGLDASASYTSVIITVPEPDKLYQEFSAGLRASCGKIRLKGIPHILPIRRKAGTATGFSIVDVGSNWLRFYRTGTTENEPAADRVGLRRVIDVAARQGDGRGDERQAISFLDAGLTRHPDAPAIEPFDALLYPAELCMRIVQDGAADLAQAAGLLRESCFGRGSRAAIGATRGIARLTTGCARLALGRDSQCP